MRRSPSALTAELLKKDGWLVETTERWIPGANIRKDLLGFIDQLCFKDGEVLAVQATSWTNISARVAKITESPNLPLVRKIGWGIWVIGWKWDSVAKEWRHRIVDVS
jgi:hypothetical protein